MGRKIAATLMALVLAVGLCPAAALADGAGLAAGGAPEALAAQVAGGDLAVCKKAKKRVSLKKCKVKLAKKSYKYTGKKVKPKVTVKYKGKKLKKGRDYKVVYKNKKGKKVSAPKAAGTYKVIVKGKGSFKGKVVKKVKVKKAKLTKSKIISRYKSVLKQAVNGEGVFAPMYAEDDVRSWESYCYYRLFNFDNEGVPELIVRTGSFTGNQYDYVFSIEGNSVVYWGSYWCATAGLFGSSDGELYMAGWRQGYCKISRIYYTGEMNVVTIDEGRIDDYDAFCGYIDYYFDGWATPVETSRFATDYSLLRKVIRNS